MVSSREILRICLSVPLQPLLNSGSSRVESGPRIVASRRTSFLPRILLVTDSLAVLLTWVFFRQVDDLQFVVAALAMQGWYVSGLYRRRLSLSVLDDLPRLALSVLVAVGTVVAASTLVHGTADRSLTFRGLLFLVLVIPLRAAAYEVVRRDRARRKDGTRTVVLGGGLVGARLARTIQERREYGLRLVGLVDDAPIVGAGLPAPLLGGHRELTMIIERYDIHVLMVAFGGIPESELVALLRTCDRLDCEIYVIPRLFEMQNLPSKQMDWVWGIPLAHLRRAPFRSAAWQVKRLIDVSVAAVSLVVLSPLMLAIALAVRIEGGPHVLFRQTRIGLDGRPFSVIKFRSLTPSSEDESRTHWNVSHDNRIGRVGRFLRKSSLDELPQLFNVLRGDMSLVGPRPERPHFATQFAGQFPRYDHRHRVPAGLTGLAAVQGLRGDTSIEERQQFDNVYIENWSLWMDFKILTRTIGSVFRRPGA